MSATKNILCSAVLGCALLLSTGNARADGIVMAPSALAPEARSQLEQQIQAAKAANPAVFAAVKNLKGHRYENYKNNRNPYPTVARELRGLGPAALMPMLEALAVNQPARGSLTDAEWDALTLGMLDTVGMIRDARARPVLLAAFAAQGLRPTVLAAAGRALGRLGGDAELALLVKHAKDRDPLAPYAVGGLGWMRRVESAKHLAALLGSTKDAQLATAAAEALGTVGSSWAWRALGEKRAAEGLAVRKICAEALAPSFVRNKGDVRTRSAESLLMLEHPATAELLRAARPQKGATAKAVDHLIVRVQEQQARRKH